MRQLPLRSQVLLVPLGNPATPAPAHSTSRVSQHLGVFTTTDVGHVTRDQGVRITRCHHRWCAAFPCIWPPFGASPQNRGKASALRRADTWLWVRSGAVCFHPGRGFAGIGGGGVIGKEFPPFRGAGRAVAEMGARCLPRSSLRSTPSDIATQHPPWGLVFLSGIRLTEHLLAQSVPLCFATAPPTPPARNGIFSAAAVRAPSCPAAAVPDMSVCNPGAAPAISRRRGPWGGGGSIDPPKRVHHQKKKR